MNNLNKQNIIGQLEDYDTEASINIYNEYANANGYEMIFDNDEETINCIYSDAWDAIQASNNKDYRDHQSYFTYNGYGHMISFDYSIDDNSPIDYSEIVEWIINNDLYNDFDLKQPTTNEDKLDAIQDNITDDRNMLLKVLRAYPIQVKSIHMFIDENSCYNDYEEYLEDEIVHYIHKHNLQDEVIELLSIDI